MFSLFPCGRRSLVNGSKLLVAELPGEGISILPRMASTGGSWNGNDLLRPLQQPVQHHLARALAALQCNRLERVLKRLLLF
jgi:hypothetical protein